MNILLLGANGQVGWELRRSLSPVGSLTAMGRNGLCGYAGDLSNPSSLEKTLRHFRPDVIVNAAAYTAVDFAESNTDQAYSVNAVGPKILADYARQTQALFIHYSTDYVFDGTGSAPWSEEAQTNPLNVYGDSKLLGEQNICASGCKSIILRTSWVYSSFGHSFISTMMRLIREKSELKVVNDQFGAPTSAALIADVTAILLRGYWHRRFDQYFSSPSLLFNLAAAGETSWYDYAQYIKKCMLNQSLKVCAVIKPIATCDYPVKAQRPLNSRLDINKLTQFLDMQIPNWKEGVSRAVAEHALSLSI